MSPINPTADEIVIVANPTFPGILARVTFPKKDAYTYEISFPQHKNISLAAIIESFQHPGAYATHGRD